MQRDVAVAAAARAQDSHGFARVITAHVSYNGLVERAFE